jgi:hypothetical protein
MAKTCPVAVHTATVYVRDRLWDHSPTNGFFATRLEGVVELIQGRTGKTLAQFSVQASIK